MLIYYKIGIVIIWLFGISLGYVIGRKHENHLAHKNFVKRQEETQKKLTK